MIDELLEEYPDPPQPGALRGLMSENAPSAGYTRPRPAPRARPEMPDFLGLYNQVQAAAQRPPRENSEGALARIMERAGSLADKHMAAGRTPRNDGFAFAAAMLAPTKTGHFSESLSRGLGTLAESRSEDAKLREQYMNVIMKGLMPTTVGRSLMQPLTGQVVGTDPSVADERAAKILESRMKAYEADNARIDTLEQREDTAWNTEQAAQQRAAAAAAERQAARDQNAELRRELAEAARANRPEPAPTLTTVIGPDGKTPVVMNARTRDVIGNAPEKVKPILPNTAVGAEVEDLEIIGGMTGVNKDLEEFERKIEDKKLDLGLVGNTVARVRNFVGASSPQSQEFASLKAAMERARNQSLLLHKGVQTEGDAQRAWNELFENMNDSDVVAKRLAEIRNINERAVKIKMLGVDSRRQNFGAEPYDFSKYLDQRAAIVDAKPKGLGTNNVQGRVGEVQPNNRGITRQRPSNALPDGFNWEK